VTASVVVLDHGAGEPAAAERAVHLQFHELPRFGDRLR